MTVIPIHYKKITIYKWKIETVISVSKVKNGIETENKYCYKNLKRKKIPSLIVGRSKWREDRNIIKNGIRDEN